jgi:hypothetical protein
MEIATEGPKLSRYQQAGSPIRCYLPSCQKPFLGSCIHANDGHFYCSHGCADEGMKSAPTAKIEPFRRKKA